MTKKSEKSIFLGKEGYSPKNKVLDFLIIHQEFDYSLQDIAKYARISYPCMKQLKKELELEQWIVLTRNVGRAQMYKLNKTKKVKKFIEFYWSVINEELDSHLTSKNHTTLSSGSVAIPMSTKNI